MINILWFSIGWAIGLCFATACISFSSLWDEYILDKKAVKERKIKRYG